MTETQVNDYIDKLRFRTYKKVLPNVLHKFPNMNKDTVREIVRKRIHDRVITNTHKRIYQVKIFSKFHGSWFTDLYDNLNGHNPRYWQIFINTNTRYAVAYELQDKTADSINSNLQQFVNQYHPRKITSDEEAGLIAKRNMDYLASKKCGVFIVQERNHSTLGIIDRFIRTLRDMNTAQMKPVRDDNSDEQFQYISPNKMKKLLKSYNNTVHSATKHTPAEMMANPQMEEEYIKKCLAKQDQQLGIKDFKLKVGDYVRYITDRDRFNKRRYNLSREAYKIDDVLGNIYTLIASDGTTRNLPRWRLLKVPQGEIKRFGKTLGTDKGVVERVLNRVSNNRVNVKFKMPDGSNYTKIINVSELRMPYPQIKSKYERGV